jgi:DNA-binding CsgD family transcriptional regulator
VSQIAFLKDKFGLTPAEARLVLRLVAGNTLKLSAAALDIGYETARTTLKSVFHKTRTCRQAELVIVIIHAMKKELEVPRTPMQLSTEREDCVR